MKFLGLVFFFFCHCLGKQELPEVTFGGVICNNTDTHMCVLSKQKYALYNAFSLGLLPVCLSVPEVGSFLMVFSGWMSVFHH